MIANPYQQYQNNSILTASKNELTLMLYNGAIKFCNQAIEAIKEGSVQEGHNYIMRAQDIIEELRITLNKAYPIALEMDKLYEFASYSLIEANITKDTNKIEDALYIMREFRDVWKEITKPRA